MKEILKKTIGVFLLICLPLFGGHFFVTAATTASISMSVTSTISVIICGDDSVDSGEQCDGSDLDGQSCSTLGYTGGNLSCESDCTFNTSSCTSGGGGGGGGGGGYQAPSTETKVIIRGKAYPNLDITLIKDGRVISTVKADEQAIFEVTVSDLSKGVHTFGVWGMDKKGVKSITFNFTINITEGVITTISGIFIPPTINLRKNKLERGEPLYLLGQTAPGSGIKIYINSEEEIIKETTAGEDGTWFYEFDTSVLEDGVHLSKTKAFVSQDDQSSFSNTLSFLVGEGKLPFSGKTDVGFTDINSDGKVNLTDFSILLYYWGNKKPKNERVDINFDGKVNLTDFSILLYYWTG